MVTLADGKFSGGDPSAAKQSVVGDLLCLLSAVVYGAYTVAIRWVEEHSREGGSGLEMGRVSGVAGVRPLVPLVPAALPPQITSSPCLPRPAPARVAASCCARMTIPP